MQNSSLPKPIVKKSIPIVYEDNALCIVNKPYGLPVQGGAHIHTSLVDILTKQLAAPIYPVHRLDKETTGLLITAKTPQAAQECRLLFDSHHIKKEYIALCFGTCRTARTGTINEPIRENGILKPAMSTYRFIAGNKNYSLFAITLHTGRMHQIRIHLAYIGNPIIGDDKHGIFALNKSLWKEKHIKKLQLCAYRLTIPIHKQEKTFSIDYPPHIQEAIEQLIPEKATRAPCVPLRNIMI